MVFNSFYALFGYLMHFMHCVCVLSTIRYSNALYMPYNAFYASRLRFLYYSVFQCFISTYNGFNVVLCFILPYNAFYPLRLRFIHYSVFQCLISTYNGFYVVFCFILSFNAFYALRLLFIHYSVFQCVISTYNGF